MLVCWKVNGVCQTLMLDVFVLLSNPVTDNFCDFSRSCSRWTLEQYFFVCSLWFPNKYWCHHFIEKYCSVVITLYKTYTRRNPVLITVDLPPFQTKVCCGFSQSVKVNAQIVPWNSFQLSPSKSLPNHHAQLFFHLLWCYIIFAAESLPLNSQRIKMPLIGKPKNQSYLFIYYHRRAF
jgi:hypothetical protein